MQSNAAKALLALGLAAPVLAAPRAVNAGGFSNDVEKATAVKDAFRIAMSGYFDHAFPNDQLAPVSNGFNNAFTGWGATAVDGLSTAIIMREIDTVNRILNFIPTIDFNTTRVVNDDISLFETTIRYLGGLLSSHDLLSGPYADLDVDPDLVRSLLAQATILANSLSVAFDTPSGVPDNEVFLNPTHRHGTSTTNSIAGFGTLILEWTRLSDLTGDPKYAQFVAKAEDYLINPTGVPEAFPGLVGTTVSILNGSFLSANGGWVGGDDSFYEYLIKMYLYNPAEFEKHKERWVTAADSTIAHLVSHPSTRPDLTFLAQFRGQDLIPVSQHLASFAGGNFIMGGILLGVPEYVQFGLALTDSYFETYSQTTTGIGPEIFQWFDAALPTDANNVPPSAADQAFFETAGFWSTDGAYIQRPETLESVWYAYRATGDGKYRDMAWQAFLAINETTAVGSGYSGIFDVMQPGGGGFFDEQESFFLAETLKYLYLIFGEQDSPVQFQASGQNSFVFNTEAHPVRVRNH